MVHICAEIGSNHMGSLELALEHIRFAKECGANSTKWQLFRAESLESDPVKQAKRKPYELPLEWLPILKEESVKRGLLFGVTPFALDLVEPLRGIVDFVKIAALDMCWDDLIIKAASLDVPLIISVAGATHEELNHLDRYVLHQRLAWEVTYLHGVTHYPATLNEMNLLKIRELQDEFPEAWTGLSDHTLRYEAAVIATALGASWIEKHFRCSFKAAHDLKIYNSPDYMHSANPTEMRLLVEKIRETETALGVPDHYGPVESEKGLFGLARRSNSKTLRG